MTHAFTQVTFFYFILFYKFDCEQGILQASKS